MGRLPAAAKPALVTGISAASICSEHLENVTVQYPKTHMGTDTLVSASRQQGISPQVLRPEYIKEQDI